MKEKRLNPGSDSDERVGILPAGELYIDHEILGDGTSDRTLTEYLTASDVARLKSLLALGGAMSDDALLDLLASRFKRGHDMLEWLHAAGILTAPSLDDWSADRRQVVGPAAELKLGTRAAASCAFAPGVKFYDVKGVPVALEFTPSGALVGRAVDPTPRYFPVNSIFRNGTEISRETFDDMVTELLETQNLKQIQVVWSADD